jgi:hypothetical protein
VSSQSRDLWHQPFPGLDKNEFFAVHVTKTAFVVGYRSGILLVKEFLISLGFPSMTSFLNHEGDGH